MNKVILMGRLTRDAEIRYAQGDNSLAIARFSLAVDRRYSKNAEEQSTDFINCVAFGKIAEFFERFGRKGTKFVVDRRTQKSAIGAYAEMKPKWKFLGILTFLVPVL